jgi:type I restriction enzyme R subunit
LLDDFLKKIVVARESYLEDIPKGSPDEQLEAVVYGKFLDREARKKFFDDFKDVEILYEILSPSPELRDHIQTYKRLAALYATVRNAYADQTNFVGDLAYKTRKLIEQNATQEGLGSVIKTVTFDVATIEALKNAAGSDEAKVFNLVRGLQHEIDEDQTLAPVLQSFRDRAERILKDLQDMTINGLAAMDLIAALANEKEEAMKSASDSGLSSKAFGVFLGLKDELALSAGGVLPLDVARDSDELLKRFPNAAVNSDEQRRFRSSLYNPLASLPIAEKTRLVDKIMSMLFGA